MEELAFNELSFEKCTTKNFSGFFTKWMTVKGLLRMDDYPRIRFTIQQINQKNEMGCTFNDIIQNSTLDEIEIKVLFSHINDMPYIDDTYPDKLLYQGNDGFGLTDSYYSNIPCISIPTNVSWDSFIITADELDISEDGLILSKPVEVLNIGNLDNYQGTWFEELIPLRYSNINEFIEYIVSAYMNVVISNATIDFLRMNQSQTIMGKFESSVEKLNKYCSQYWKRENVMWNQIKDLGLNVRPESTQTLQKFGHERRFKNENNSNEQFSYHFDMPNANRAYVKPLTEDKKFFIANIVSHLNTITG